MLWLMHQQCCFQPWFPDTQEEPCAIAGDRLGMFKTFPRAEMSLCVTYNFFFFFGWGGEEGKKTLSNESTAVAEILLDSQSQKQEIPPRHGTVKPPQSGK